MPKQIESKHRNRKLAERKATRIGGRIVARRSGSGRFSVRGRFFTFEISSDLTRFTVAVTFPFREEYGSVLAQLYTGLKWSPLTKDKSLRGTTLRTERDKGATREAAVRAVEEATGYDRELFWFDLDGVIATETIEIEFDKRFAERIVVLTEIEGMEPKTKGYRRK